MRRNRFRTLRHELIWLIIIGSKPRSLLISKIAWNNVRDNQILVVRIPVAYIISTIFAHAVPAQYWTD